MCGICGIYSLSGKPVPREPVEWMKDAMAHRGPDDHGTYYCPEAALGHRRLSIIDLEGGHQPLSDSSGGSWIVFNGEIYNYRALRRELKECSVPFRTRSDTEVILQLYLNRGLEFLPRLRGMFGLAIWSSAAGELLLARDRPGIKPLYFFQGKDYLLFASEVKALLATGLVPRELEMKALQRYVAFGYTSGEETVFRGIRKLKPGTFLRAKGPKVEIRPYWEVAPQDVPPSGRERKEKLRALLEEAVEMHLVSDVPVGAFLSGGIDSTVVVGIMAGLMDRPVKTFTIGFDEKDFDESGFARQAAEAFGTEHYEEVVRPNAVELLPKLVSFFDEPFADPSVIPTYLVSRFAREHVKVVLSGDGGDELFGGYPRFFRDFREQPFRAVPAFIRKPVARSLSALVPPRRRGRKLLHRLSLPAGEGYIAGISHFDDTIWNRDLPPREAEDYRIPHRRAYIDSPFRGHKERILHLDFRTYLPDDILLKVDRMSMAHSLESRVPLLDHLVANYALSLPAEEKIRGREGKRIFKEAFHHLIPLSLMERKKKGFGIPLRSWLREDLREMVLDCLSPGRVKRRGFFDPRRVSALVSDHLNGKMDHGFRLWILLVLEIWQQQFVDGKVPVPAQPARSALPS